MRSKVCVAIILLFIFNAQAEETLSLFGSKPIQLEIGKDGVKQRKEPGFICDLTASLGGASYTEWGQTEEDARSLVHKKCSEKSGLLICKRDKASCRKES